MVLCATGYNKEDLDIIDNASKSVAVFRSANMSLGANVLIEAIKVVASLLSDFDMEIVEKHHNQKVDAPSGTALMMADAIKEILPEKFYLYGREGKVGKRTKDEIGIHAIRGGTIVGEHSVIFAGNDEVLTLTHQAQSKALFANGALPAAAFTAAQPAGLYNMDDLLA